MANDNTNKTNSSGNNSENKSNSNIDQQKVPPLRIVLNTAGNQKSSTATVRFNNNNHRNEKNQDVKTDVGTVKGGSKVRIKLGLNKQQASKGSGGNNDSTSNLAGKVTADGSQKSKNSSVDDKQDDQKDDTTFINQGHLRRITRRSHRAIQSVGNEDEESISSMTSTDENLNTNSTNNSDNTSAQDTEQSNSTTTTTSTTSTTTTTTTANNGSSNVDTPRRYKRRKGEVSESLSIDNDSFFGSQNYKLPNQNSFELYKNIRKQVDRKINSLSSIHPKAPYGFRDYMLTRGAYLLDGNKLGNGTNLFMGEDGGLHSVPLGKYHAYRYNRVNYSIPNRAKVPLGLPVNSPLYDLFIEQERERYRMRMQHIKEREKLTLAAEQEMMRVYNHAALTAVNQTEPFSACTMLKHQEVYNYLDSDGYTILCREDSHREQTKPDRVRTRRRGQPSPPPPASKPGNDETTSGEVGKKEQKPLTTDTTTSQTSKGMELQTSNDNSTESTSDEKAVKNEATECKDVTMIDSEQHSAANETTVQKGNNLDERHDQVPKDSKELTETSKTNDEEKISSEELEKSGENFSETNQTAGIPQATTSVENEKTIIEQTEKDSPKDGLKSQSPDQANKPTSGVLDSSKGNKATTSCGKDVPEESVANDNKVSDDNSHNTAPDEPMGEVENNTQSPHSSNQSITDEDRKTQDREAFLSELQEIDDKWEKIRNEMLIRHRNEAESLHAIQKLEWEWKTKEIGACDVRTTPIIDSTLVPKLNIYSQDY